MKLRRTIAVAAATAAFVVGSPAAGAQQLPQLPALPPMPAAPQAPTPADLTQFFPDLAPAPPVNPDAANNYVSFGDSLAANPTALDVLVSKQRAKGVDVPWPNLPENRCAQDRHAFPTQTAQKTGLRLVDYSCPGATAYVGAKANDAIPHNTFGDQVDKALSEGELNASTKLVSVSIGVNDVYQPGNFGMEAQPERMRQYHEAVAGGLNRIKNAAPNARIVMLGLPDQTDGANHTCATNLLGVVSHWYFPIVSYYQDEVRNQQRDAASTAGVEFYDMVAEINLAKGNNGCSPNPNRLSASVFDDRPHNLTFHLTDAGHVYYSDRLANRA